MFAGSTVSPSYPNIIGGRIGTSDADNTVMFISVMLNVIPMKGIVLALAFACGMILHMVLLLQNVSGTYRR